MNRVDTKILFNPIQYKEIIHHTNICVSEQYTYIIMQVTEKYFSLEKHLNILTFLVSEQCTRINKIILWIKAYALIFFFG